MGASKPSRTHRFTNLPPPVVDPPTDRVSLWQETRDTECSMCSLQPSAIIRPRSVVAAVLVVSTFALPPAAASGGTEAIEIGSDNTGSLPRGKEADGIQGDFVLRNRHIEAAVSGNLPGRKANMTTHSGSITPGTLFDLCLRGCGNDQLTLFAPGNQQGPVSTVEIKSAGDGQAMVLVERSAARGDGKEVSHLYWLEEDWRHILVVSQYAQHRDAEWKVAPAPVAKGLKDVASFKGIHYGDAMNPADRQGYAWAAVETEGSSTGELAEVVLGKGDRRTYAVIVAPGYSPAEAYGVVAGQRGAVGTLSARVHQGDAGVSTATFEIRLDKETVLPAYPRPDGAIDVSLPPGAYPFEARDLGRSAVSGTFTISEGEATTLDVPMAAASRIEVEISERGAAEGSVFPCKVQFIGIAGTASPHLGVDIQARGCRNQYHSESGRFSVQVPPGNYLVVATRGIEYSHLSALAIVEPGRKAEVRGQLERVVDTSGWVSTDFHNHSTPSGDNYTGTDDRVINLAAEHIEFAPTTEHNRFYDWGPHIAALGLEKHLKTIVGIELTGDGAHFNSFPMKVVPWVQDNGAPTWQQDPRINAIVLRDFQGGGAERYVQINHPHVGRFFRDRNIDGIADGGFVGLERLVDAAEVWSTEIFNHSPWLAEDRQNRTFAWLQLLNQGRNMFCVSVSDAHSIFGNGVGGWRTYVPSATDAPDQIDHREIIRGAKAGRMVVTNGPYLEVSLDDGTLPGGRTIASGEVAARVSIQCTDWIDIDRVQVLVNGRMEPALNFTRAKHEKMFGKGTVKFRHTIAVPVPVDSHIIVAAAGEGFDLKSGYGESWQSAMHPVAYSNPIWVDVDGNGFEPNGDTLGHPLPVGKKL